MRTSILWPDCRSSSAASPDLAPTAVWPRSSSMSAVAARTKGSSSTIMTVDGLAMHSALWHGVSRVETEVHQRELELVFVDQRPGQTRRDFRPDLHHRPQGPLQQPDHAADEAGDIDLLRLELL